MDKNKKKKVQCLTCGSVYDDDYKTRHEIKQHAGKKFWSNILEHPKIHLQLQLP